MVYIDSFDSKSIVGNPPKKKVFYTEEQKQMQNDVLNLFWHTMGVVIAENFEETKQILKEYGHSVSNEKEAATAISEMIGTKDWKPFLDDMSPILNELIDKKFS